MISMTAQFDTLYEKLKTVGIEHSPSNSTNVCICGVKYFTHGNVLHEPSNDEWNEVIMEHIAEKQAQALIEVLTKEATNE